MYFRFGILNSLRDELWLTLTMQKATLFVMFYAGIPAGGLGFGLGWGLRTHSLWRGLLGSAVGLGSGLFLAWLLPTLLWPMLCWCARKRWFLQPAPPPTVPTISRESYLARSSAYDREMNRKFAWWLGLFIPGVLASLVGLSYTKREMPDSAMNGLAGIGAVLMTIGPCLWLWRSSRQLAKKHGLECPNCGRELPSAPGSDSIPDVALCRHCGVKLIEG